MKSITLPIVLTLSVLVVILQGLPVEKKDAKTTEESSENDNKQDAYKNYWEQKEEELQHSPNSGRGIYVGDDKSALTKRSAQYTQTPSENTQDDDSQDNQEYQAQPVEAPKPVAKTYEQLEQEEESADKPFSYADYIKRLNLDSHPRSPDASYTRKRRSPQYTQAPSENTQDDDSQDNQEYQAQPTEAPKPVAKTYEQPEQEEESADKPVSYADYLKNLNIPIPSQPRSHGSASYTRKRRSPQYTQAPSENTQDDDSQVNQEYQAQPTEAPKPVAKTYEQTEQEEESVAKPVSYADYLKNFNLPPTRRVQGAGYTR